MVKFKATGQILGLPAPEGVIRRSRADMSFAARLLMDKDVARAAVRQQRLEASGIKVSRPWLTQLPRR